MHTPSKIGLPMYLHYTSLTEVTAIVIAIVIVIVIVTVTVTVTVIVTVIVTIVTVIVTMITVVSSYYKAQGEIQYYITHSYFTVELAIKD